jgi:hypothetical protein
VSASPVRCSKCDAPVPLIGATSFKCPFCGADVHVAHKYAELFRANALEHDARRELETRYARVSRVPPPTFDVVAIALVVLLPAIVTSIWMSVAARPPNAIDLFTHAIIPAALPGTILWMWSASIHATVVRFQIALAASAPAKPGDAPACRQCGAPLAVGDAIFARCAYCGTDSLVAELATALHRLDEALRSELRTIEQAIVALAVRRRLVVGGVAIAAAVLGVLVAVLRITGASS